MSGCAFCVQRLTKNMAKKKKEKKQHKLFWHFARLQIFLICLVLAGVTWYFMSGWGAKIAKMKNEADYFVRSSNEETFRKNQTSIAYDVNGSTLSVIKGEKDVYYVTSEQIPSYAKDAMVSIEDKKFYEHHGIDYKAIMRAAIAMIQEKEITQGASTITQQLARNVFLTQERTWERKIEEIFIATALEKKYSKESILEFYLNNIYFGNGYYGLQAAAMGYFSRDISELSVSEIAFLCAIPNNPSYYDPLTHFDHTITRRNLVLENMLEDRLISENTYTKAVHETIVLEQSEETVQKHDYAETYTFYCATRALMEMSGFVFQTQFSSDAAREKYEKEYDKMYDECNAKLFSGGYRIYTSLNLNTQAQLQKCLDTVLGGFTEKTEEGIYTLQGAATCIDNATGYVEAIVGGRSQESAGHTLNRAFQSYRQPGSAIKPLIVYTPALERNYTPDSIVTDRRLPDGPENADGRFSGNMTLRRAVEISKNTIAWQIFEEMTPEVGLEYLRQMDFARIVDDDEVAPAALGGLTNGVSTLEMAKGYATIENDGAYREPTCILKITDAMNNILYAPDAAETMVYDETAAREMTDILCGVLTSKGATAYGRGLGDMPAAAKTGTTNDNKDGWFVGYTRYYTTAVWVGYDQPRTVKGLSGANFPGSIWQSFMLQLHEGLEPRNFLPPKSVIEEPIERPEITHLPEERPTEDMILPAEPVQEQPVDQQTQQPTEGVVPAPTEPTVIEDTLQAVDNGTTGANAATGTTGTNAATGTTGTNAATGTTGTNAATGTAEEGMASEDITTQNATTQSTTQQ